MTKNIEDALRERGDKIDFHVRLYPRELKVIDNLAIEHDCSRAEIIGAWSRLYKNENLAGKVRAGRREGAGRKPRKPPIIGKGFLS